jgi:hypothetical protein
VATTKSKTTRRAPKKERAGRNATISKTPISPKASAALKRAEEALWNIGIPPHELLQHLHESLLLRCLREANGNYAAAAAMFGPSRQSVQQYANSPLRDARWKQYQQNKRKGRRSERNGG